MAKTKAAKAPRVRKAGRPANGRSLSVQAQQTRSDNPMDWLYDNPLGAYPDFVFGILKQSYHGFPNSAVEFGGRKLRPIEGRAADGSVDLAAITAYRHGTVLPDDAPDSYDEIEVLLKAVDLAACAHESALLVYLTLSFPDARRLHHCWEEGRAFSLEAFARNRQLPVGLIQHRPGEVGSNNPAHLHLLVGARRLDGTGFRGYAADLLTDEGQRTVHDEWLAFRAAWSRVR